jgi:glycosyltransferase involved in cell wall biosynthesis
MMKMPEQLVSVIIIVRNGEKYLAQAIESVLAQSVPPSELLVIDGHSTDQTPVIAASYPSVQLVQQSGSGIANARNLGLELAAGQLIAFLDHDDVWLPNKLARQISALNSSEHAAYCLAGFSFIGRPHRGRGQQLAGTPSVLLAKRRLFKRIGGFDQSFTIGCDAEWFIRARDLEVPHVVVQEVLAYKRLHQSNISLNADLNRREMFQIIKMSLARKQGQTSGQG